MLIWGGGRWGGWGRGVAVFQITSHRKLSFTWWSFTYLLFQISFQGTRFWKIAAYIAFLQITVIRLIGGNIHFAHHDSEKYFNYTVWIRPALHSELTSWRLSVFNSLVLNSAVIFLFQSCVEATCFGQETSRKSQSQLLWRQSKL